MKCCVVFLMTNDNEKGFQVPHLFFSIIKVNNLCLCFPLCILQIASSPGRLCPLFSSAHHLQVTSDLNDVLCYFVCLEYTVWLSYKRCTWPKRWHSWGCGLLFWSLEFSILTFAIFTAACLLDWMLIMTTKKNVVHKMDNWENTQPREQPIHWSIL